MSTVRLTLLLAALLCPGCTSFLNPIVAPSGPALDSALIGRWIATTDEGTFELEIKSKGREGVASVRSSKDGEQPELEELRLITAKLGRITYASVTRPDKPEDSWTLFTYEIAGDRLMIHSENGRFWNEAVRNHRVSGSVEKKDWTETATVTASERKLRAVVRRHRDAFDGKPLLELHRQ